MLWAAEYSASQDAFHIKRWADALTSNLRRVLRKDPSLDWVIFAVGSLEAVGRIVDEVRDGQARLLRGRDGG